MITQGSQMLGLYGVVKIYYMSFPVGSFDLLLAQAILIYYFINFDLYVFHMIILM